MATIVKVGKKFKAQVRLNGISKSKTFETKNEAHQWALDTERQAGRFKGVPTAHTLKSVMERYAKEVSSKKKGEKWELIRINMFSKYDLANIPIAEITTDDVQLWVDKRSEEVSGSSVCRELTLLSNIFEVARKQWKLHNNKPITDVRRPKQAPPRERRISEKEIERILKALFYEENKPIENTRQVIAVAFLFALETAMRQGEYGPWSGKTCILQTDTFTCLIPKMDIAETFLCLKEL